MTKKELRQIGKELRYSLAEEKRLDYDKQIRSSLLVELKGCKEVAIFLPISKFKEIDLTPLLQNEEFNFYAPKSFFEDRRLEFTQVHATDIFDISDKGIPEPKSNDFIKPEILDAVVIPMLISDESGFRVGYGMGFYDNFLKRCRKDCLRLGVNYFSPVEKISDVEIHDEPLHKSIYPKEL